MITAADCLRRYGPPQDEAHMVLWDVPKDLEIAAMPKRIYCNRDLVAPLEQALRNLRRYDLGGELRTWDGCFNIRRKRGARSASLHSWGIAIDVNAAWNPFGGTPTLSAEFVDCFTRARFDWGGEWTCPDGMHFQLARFPD